MRRSGKDATFRIGVSIGLCGHVFTSCGVCRFVSTAEIEKDSYLKRETTSNSHFTQILAENSVEEEERAKAQSLCPNRTGDFSG
jgi:hypothetical protein